VRVQAVKALSLAQRRIFGDRYKVPRLLVEQIIAEPSFRNSIAATGATLGLTREESLGRAERALRELGTSHNLFAMELFRRFTRWVYTLAYDPEIDVDPGSSTSCASSAGARRSSSSRRTRAISTTWRSTRFWSRRASRRRTRRRASTCRSSR